MKSNKEKHCLDEIHKIFHMKLIINQSLSSMCNKLSYNNNPL